MSDPLDDAGQVAQVVTGKGPVDPAYQDMFGGDVMQTTQEADRRVGFEPFTPFTHYILKPLSADGRLIGDNDTPTARVMLEIAEGIDGTEGRRAPMDVFFISNPESMNRKTKQMERLSDAKFAEKKENRRGLLLRLQRCFKLAQAFPGSFQEPAVQAYAQQYEGNPSLVIGEVRIETGTDGIKRNRVVAESIASPDDPVKDANKKVIPGKTAIQEAREKIAARKASDLKRGARGGTARQFAGA